MNAMERAACNVIYVDRNVCEEGLIHSLASKAKNDPPSWESGEARQAIQPLLDAFGDGWFLHSPTRLDVANRPISPRVRYRCRLPIKTL